MKCKAIHSNLVEKMGGGSPVLGLLHVLHGKQNVEQAFSSP